jgi:hypothetical protein
MREGRLGHRIMDRAFQETQEDDDDTSRAKRQKSSTSQPASPLRGTNSAGKSLTPTSIGRQHSSARLWSPAAPRAEGQGGSPSVSRQPSLQPKAFRTLSGEGGGGGGGLGGDGGAEAEEGQEYEVEESVIRVGAGYQAEVPQYQPPVRVSVNEEEAIIECVGELLHAGVLVPSAALASTGRASRDVPRKPTPGDKQRRTATDG